MSIGMMSDPAANVVAVAMAVGGGKIDATSLSGMRSAAFEAWSSTESVGSEGVEHDMAGARAIAARSEARTNLLMSP
jgi:hypothetical protein